MIFGTDRPSLFANLTSGFGVGGVGDSRQRACVHIAERVAELQFGRCALASGLSKIDQFFRSLFGAKNKGVFQFFSACISGALHPHHPVIRLGGVFHPHSAPEGGAGLGGELRASAMMFFPASQPALLRRFPGQ